MSTHSRHRQGGSVATRRPTPATTSRGRQPLGQAAAPPTRRPAPRRVQARRWLTPKRFGVASIAVVLSVVLGLVLVSLTTGSGPGGHNAPAIHPVTAGILAEVNAVTPLEATAVGVPSSVHPPVYDQSQAQLVGAGGKVKILYIGGEFCPNCAGERWAIVMALSRFGAFGNLNETTSSPWDSYPSTATFTFHESTYASQYLDFEAIEHTGNDTSGLGTRKALDPLTAAQSELWSTYESRYGQSPAYPFLDIGNRVLFLSASYDPGILAGLDHSQIAARLSNPDDPVTRAIVGSANYVTAGICALTGSKVSPWCGNPAVKSAAQKIGL